MTSLKIFHLRQSDTIVSHIKNLVWQGVLQPGDRIPPERDLARELQLGRGTVREAMQQLEALGLIVKRQKSRVVRAMNAEPEGVPELSLEGQRQFLIQVIDVRIGLEGWVASEVARKADAADLRNLKRIVAELDRSAALREDLVPLDREFHQALIQATKNLVVLQVLDTLMTMISSIAAFKKLTLDPGRTLHTDLHHAIVDAIERRDPAAARAAMTAHLESARSAVQGKKV